ncbi:DUF2567 domain-containing protein [Nocardia sp. NPDC005366]|uniref:DUF2567 domain-containing protein n=1 Tax=Nocardia sp. NPDC005366 TaxID=3156878 RepID=UPI0033B3E6E7
MAAVNPGGLRREVGAGLLIVAGVVLASVVGGAVWGYLAPVEQLFVTEAGRGVVLTGESAHQFDALAIFVCIGAVVGLLCAAGAWRLRSARGPILAIGLLAGSFIGAFAMRVLGEAVAEWHHARPEDPPVGQIIAIAPELGSWLALIVQPLIASLVLMFTVALNPSEDLGTGVDGAFGATRSTRSTRSTQPYPSNTKADAASPYSPYSPAANGAHGGYDPAGPVPQSRPAR